MLFRVVGVEPLRLVRLQSRLRDHEAVMPAQPPLVRGQHRTPDR